MFSLQVGQRISLIIVIAVVILLILGGVSYVNIDYMEEEAGDIDIMQEIRVNLYRVEGNVWRSLANVYEFFLTEDEEDVQEFEEARNNVYEEVYEARDYSQISQHPQEFLLELDRLEEEINTYFSDAEEMIYLWRAGHQEQVMILLEDEVLEDDIERISAIINHDIDVLLAQRFLAEEREEFTRAAAMTRSTVLVGIPLGTILLIIMAFLITINITRPLRKLTTLIKNLATGDFTIQTDIASKDEIGQMASSINETISSLKETLQYVQTSSQSVSNVTEEIASGNQDLSQRTEEQASSLEEISSIIGEITRGLEGSSANAADADSLSQGTVASVEMGEGVVEELQGAMEDITQGSQEISAIVAKVNDIAFQTNLLALNAAVEAARAGEKGRGFAVVAAEVRSLARKAAEFSHEIEMLVNSSIKEVQRGSSLMEDTQTVFAHILDSNQELTDVISKIALSLKEKSEGARDIRQAIEELNRVTQQNATMVEEIASSSESMSTEAIDLSERVSSFKLDNSKPDNMSSHG